MRVVPAVDLREGRCVQLVGGRPEVEPVSLPDPVAAARGWWERGFASLHIVDLDAALGTGGNTELIRHILAATPAEAQVGGGVRDDARAAALLAAGARRIIVGTRALDDPDWLPSLAERFPGRVLLALDTRDGKVLRRGWTEASTLTFPQAVARLGDTPLAGILATDVGREGRLAGLDRKAVAATLDASPFPTWISGGVTRLQDLEWLEERGAHAAVLGMTLYTETIDIDEVARRWGGRALLSPGNDS
ncbi:MAG: HisA/HisF-related TIM barrel protein [Gemmatimonadota bacterium]